MNKRILLLLGLTFFLNITANAQTQFIKYKKYLIPIGQACDKPRVAVTLDLTNNGGDPNEWQDFAHFLAYSNYFDVRAIVASKGPDNTVGSSADIKDVLTLYGGDLSELNQHASINNLGQYSTEAELKGLVRDNGSSGINLIKSEADASSPACPLNVLVWGAADVIASALDNLTEEAKDHYRIIAIGSSNQGADPTAWSNLLSRGGSRVVYSHTDNTFRGFYSPLPNQGGHGSNSSPFCNVGSIDLFSGTNVETFMNSISATTGIRKAIKDHRVEASWLNCGQAGTRTNPTYNYSARFADFTTTLYLLDEINAIPSLNGNVKSIFENRLGPSALGPYRDEVFGDFLNKINAIYN